jgi:hypothetical protein
MGNTDGSNIIYGLKINFFLRVLSTFKLSLGMQGGNKQSGRLSILSLLNRFGDGLAGTGAEESLLVVSQQDFPR